MKVNLLTNLLVLLFLKRMLAFSIVGLRRSSPQLRKLHEPFALFNARFSDSGFRSDNRFSSGGRSRGRPIRTRGDQYNERFNREDRHNSNRFPSRTQSYSREEKTEPAWGYYDGDHLFGISPISLALSTSRRKITELLVQEGMDLANKKDKKAAENILKVATERGIPIREFSKHDLNMITDNKLHQGFVLRAQPLEFETLTHLEASEDFKCVLALDEVWDPMNFGALVRTSYFLGVDKVVICAKNSAPLSPTVSKASAGAVELMTIHSTNNMMNFLDKSVANGWQVVGTDIGPTSTPLNNFSVSSKPTILVLGNEGHGIRTNILKRCTSLVRICRPSTGGAASELDDSSASEVDSLNVSVTGGIILNHLLANRK